MALLENIYMIVALIAVLLAALVFCIYEIVMYFSDAARKGWIRPNPKIEMCLYISLVIALALGLLLALTEKL